MPDTTSTTAASGGASGGQAAGSGGGWSAAALIDPLAGETQPLTSVSCPTADFCMAVDFGGNAIIYTAGAWQAPQQLARGDAGEFTAVSCASPTFCEILNGFGETYSFDGTTYAGPNDETDVDHAYIGFKALSCPLVDDCVSADQYGEVFRYDGSNWYKTVSGLNGVNIALSCYGQDQCLVTDNAGHADVLQGKVMVPIAGPGVTGSYVVSCANAGFCLMGAAFQALVFDGAQWQAPQNVNPAPLTSISCPATGFCLGVGLAPVGATTNVSVFNGQTWSAIAGPSIGDAVAVSCSSPSHCVAISRAEASIYNS